MESETDPELREWASREHLTSETMEVLAKEGFLTLNLLKLLTVSEVKELYQDTKLLPLAQCLALKKAVIKLGGCAKQPLDGERPSKSCNRLREELLRFLVRSQRVMLQTLISGFQRKLLT